MVASPCILQARQLEASRADRVLFRGLDFELRGGQLLQVAGRNGVGKTTLLNMVAGITRPARGEVCWQGLPVAAQRDEFLRQLSFVGHLGGLKGALTALENLEFLCRLRGLAIDSVAIVAALERVGLRGYEEVPVARLSAGQKRRVALARLFVEGSPLWILDEPFTAIDRAGVLQLESWLAEHVRSGGMVLLTTHHEFSLDFPRLALDVAAFRPGRSS